MLCESLPAFMSVAYKSGIFEKHFRYKQTIIRSSKLKSNPNYTCYSFDKSKPTLSNYHQKKASM